MILTEYNRELHIRNERALAKKEGIEKGIKAFILDYLEESIPTERILEKLQKHFDLDQEAAAQYLKQYSLKHRTEEKQMILTDYNEELRIQNERALAKNEGYQEGFQAGIDKGIETLIQCIFELSIPAEEIMALLQKHYDLDYETMLQYVKQYLFKYRIEVKQLILSEYHKELHIRSERKLAMEEGYQLGIQMAIKEFILFDLERSTPPERILENLQKYFSLDHETAAQYFKQYSDPASN